MNDLDHILNHKLEYQAAAAHSKTIWRLGAKVAWRKAKGMSGGYLHNTLPIIAT